MVHYVYRVFGPSTLRRVLEYSFFDFVCVPARWDERKTTQRSYEISQLSVFRMTFQYHLLTHLNEPKF